ncbi:condensation domain-containing protein [Rahnella laticis]|uniref:condensation domain-containing protein n=1 Tax=Rahnella laticis TaxID=2787622 RepID=UPI0018A29EE6|nr:condensation domain-containing protein [Rahnella laticis]MBF7997531.1 hypothetical protein [Rahnella laticis]
MSTVKGYLPLTSAQRGMWFANEISKKPANNNICEYITIEGSIESDIFISAIHQTIAEAGSLHCRFVQIDSEIRQFLESADSYEVVLNDFSECQSPESELEEYIKIHSTKEFHLTNGRAFEFSLIKLSPSKYVYYHCCHHILL